MTVSKTAKTATATPRKRAVRKPAAPKGVTLSRTAPKRSTGGNTDYTPFVRALWNMADAAETATTVDTNGNTVPNNRAREYYAGKRDELLNTFVQYL